MIELCHTLECTSKIPYSTVELYAHSWITLPELGNASGLDVH